ncbi:GGDEF domain-containing protein [Thalassotalea sp. PLHSN55]|uniref:GGDEF domain-containing protein n=1 Tax=Thalassotalea sp. PLHSN55 TaxID=3435888 RepID=UPI003F87AAC6
MLNVTTTPNTLSLYRNNVLFFMLIILILTFSSKTLAENMESLDFGKLLRQADSIRSSEPQKLDNYLDYLAQHLTDLSTEEKNHYIYLRIYQATFKGQYKKALDLAHELDKLKVSFELKYRTDLTIVNIYALDQNWTKGLSLLSSILSRLGSVNKDLKQRTYFVAAILYSQLGQYSLTLHYANLIEPQTDRRNCFKSQLILLAKTELKELSPNNSSIHEGIQTCIQANEFAMSSLIYTYLANLYIKDEKPLQAIEVLNENFNLSEKSQYPKVMADIASILAKSYLLINDHSNAKHFALESLNIEKDLVNTPAFITTYKVLYQIAEYEKNYYNALIYHKKYAEADKAYLDETKAKHLAFQLAKHHEFENKTQIKMLDEQNQRLLLAKELSDKQQENNYLFIALLMTLMTLLAGWAYKSWMTQRHLKELAEFDSLTGIYNRGHFVQLAQSALKHHQKSQQEISCVLFDLDHFKQINDVYGHGVGDIVLKQVVDSCQKIGRHNDIFGRLGGEEFSFILPGCSILIAEDIANRCRNAIYEIDYLSLGLSSPITASFGITDGSRSGFELDDLLADADSAMYASKHHGRNTVSVYKKPN